jgi:hypothetical protein
VVVKDGQGLALVITGRKDKTLAAVAADRGSFVFVLHCNASGASKGVQRPGGGMGWCPQRGLFGGGWEW